MSFVVSVTKQGQISIPVKIRRELGLELYKKALVYPTDTGEIVVEPIIQLTTLRGAVKTSQKVTPRKTRAVFEKYLASRKTR